MKLLLGVISIFLFLCLSTTKTHAHLAGQPPFFLINGEYSGYYPVYVTSLKDFILPQDTAPKNYLVNTPLSFTIDRNMLPFPDTIIDKTTFHWDYGDSEKGEGLTNSHTYTKPGSYLLTITADYAGYSDSNTKSLLQAVMINILPDNAYKLPQAVITIDNQKVTDPQNQPQTMGANDSISLSAADSKSGSFPIVKYFWDIGDGTKSSDKSFSHTYSDQNQLYLFPMLRVIDAKGFISDTYVQIERKSLQESPPKNQSTIIFIAGIILFNAIVIGFVYWILRKR